MQFTMSLTAIRSWLNELLWEQDITVEPNTLYQMEVWLISCVSDNPGSLQFAIDGTNLGNSFSSGATTCNWTQFTHQWTSGTDTEITFSIRSQGGFAGGNDYALDDIVFAGIATITDTIEVVVEDLIPIDLGPDTNLCEGQVMTLNAEVQGGSYLWQDGSTNPTFEVTESGTYTLCAAYLECPEYELCNFVGPSKLGNYEDMDNLKIDSDDEVSV